MEWSPYYRAERGLGRGSKGRRVLVVGRRVAVNKNANDEDSGFSIAGEQLCSEEGKRDSKKLERIIRRASKTPGSTTTGSWRRKANT